jgi:hypothetical protein
MNWTRDRVRRLARISANAALLTADLQALIHELGPEDPGKEKLTAANEELHQAEFHIDETLLAGETVWQLTDALTESCMECVPTIEGMSGSINFGEGFTVGEYLDSIRGMQNETGAVLNYPEKAGIL